MRITKKATAKDLLRRWGLIGGAVLLVGVGLLLYGLGRQVWIVSHDVLSTQPPPGRLIGVGDRTMHIECSGSGAPTVVLEPGLFTSSRIWGSVQPEVARFSRVCSYDRLGYGWSDPPSAPRSGEQIAKELWKLLDAAGETSPLVLVGHSGGGLFVRAAHALRPRAVVGLVLVDPSHEDMADELADPEFFLRVAGRMRKHAARQRWGLVHIPGVERPPQLTFPGYPPLEQRVLQASFSRAGFLGAVAGELEQLTSSSSDFARRHRRELRDTPLIVLSRSLLASSPGPLDLQPSAESSAWRESHRRLAEASSRGRLIAAERAGHDIHVEQPELVVNAIRTLVDEVNETAPPHQPR